MTTTYEPQPGDHVRVTLEGKITDVDGRGFNLTAPDPYVIDGGLRDLWFGPIRRAAMNVTVERVEPPVVSFCDRVGARVRHVSGHHEFIIGRGRQERPGILCVTGSDVGRWREEGDGLEHGWFKEYMNSEYYTLVDES